MLGARFCRTGAGALSIKFIIIIIIILLLVLLLAFQIMIFSTNTKSFKRTLIYFDTDTQYANFRGNLRCQATKKHNYLNLFAFGSCFRTLAVILFQVVVFQDI